MNASLNWDMDNGNTLYTQRSTAPGYTGTNTYNQRRLQQTSTKVAETTTRKKAIERLIHLPDIKQVTVPGLLRKGQTLLNECERWVNCLPGLRSCRAYRAIVAARSADAQPTCQDILLGWELHSWLA